MIVQRSCVYHALATEGGGVGHAVVEETHQILYVDLPLISAQPNKGKMRSAI
jgi:hypothetical protein